MLIALAGLAPVVAQAGDSAALHSRSSRSEHRSFAQIGLASWYGREKAGRRTASGEHFNPQLFTAAHRTLPLGTIVRVTNLSTGKSIKVRVNDRGPFVRRRILDLSAAAGRTLDIRRNGMALVRIEVFPSDQTRASGSLADTE
jgi:rare lipoprotein A